MSLYRQLWIGVIAVTSLVFIGSFGLNLYSAKSYLEQQLYTQSTDNAAALALSMSQQSKDDATAELLVSALFDSGHFQQVRYSNITGKVVVERQSKNPPDQVPDWFVSAIPIRAEAGTALVNDGWKQAGTVTVQAHARFAYQSLWQGALTLLLWMAVIGALTGLAATIFLNWLRRPISQMVDQAHAITERRFVTVQEPRVPEMRTVVRAMNTMVERVKAMFNEQADRISQLRSEANRDALTGLANRSFFMGRLLQALSEDDAAPRGALLIVRLHDLGGLNRRQGRGKADFFLQRVAAEFADIAVHEPDWLAARLNGADFVLLAPGVDEDAADRLARTLLGKLDELYRRGHSDDDRPAWCGFTLYAHDETPGAVLSRTDTALLHAETEPARVAASLEAAISSNPNDDWQALLQRALAENRFELASFPVFTLDRELLHRETAIRLRHPDSGELVPAGIFLPYVLRLGLAAELDLAAVKLALAEIRRNPQALAVNISADSIRSENFRSQLLILLQAASSDAAQLWLEVNEFGLHDEMATLANFVAQITHFGCRIGIEHFGRHFGSIPQLYELRLDYLKIDGSFIHDLDTQPGNQHLLRAIAGIAANLGILTIAEQVCTEAEWQTLATLGINGATGPEATRRGKH
ncbi:MAG: hypothetical protein H6R07_303 [Proteobacteria bacterium]|nr:hypothetical protein [Pseudomonadota bacterium]